MRTGARRLIGHSDNNGAEDKGHLRITYHGNHFLNVNSRVPSLRFVRRRSSPRLELWRASPDPVGDDELTLRPLSHRAPVTSLTTITRTCLGRASTLARARRCSSSRTTSRCALSPCSAWALRRRLTPPLPAERQEPDRDDAQGRLRRGQRRQRLRVVRRASLSRSL